MAEAELARVREIGRQFIAMCVDKMPHRRASELSRHLAALGILNRDTPYADDTIRSWRDGRYTAPFEVAIALARDLNLSLDEWVFGRSMGQEVLTLRQRMDKLEGQVAGPGLRSEIESLRADLQRLGARLDEVEGKVDQAPLSRRPAGGRSASSPDPPA